MLPICYGSIFCYTTAARQITEEQAIGALNPGSRVSSYMAKMALLMRRPAQRAVLDYDGRHCSYSTPKLVQPVCKRRDKGERDSHRYTVTVVTPPPKHLGVHCLPSNTQCGETVTVSGESYIVSGVVYQYQLKKGKYEPSTKKLEVQPTGRYILNMYLDSLLEKP